MRDERAYLLHAVEAIDAILSYTVDGREAFLSDGKTQDAVIRTAPILPMLPGTPERATHDYKRSGTSSLYAALDIATGKVIGSLHARHRAVEFKKFLQTLHRAVPAERSTCT